MQKNITQNKKQKLHKLEFGHCLAHLLYLSFCCGFFLATLSSSRSCSKPGLSGQVFSISTSSSLGRLFCSLKTIWCIHNKRVLNQKHVHFMPSVVYSLVPENFLPWNFSIKILTSRVIYCLLWSSIWTLLSNTASPSGFSFQEASSFQDADEQAPMELKIAVFSKFVLN